jgi:hypothetical protein
MSQTQLELDLTKEACERLRRWTQDTIMRCEVVNFPHADTLATVQTALVSELLTTFIRSRAKSHDDLHRFLVLMKEAYIRFPEAQK